MISCSTLLYHIWLNFFHCVQTCWEISFKDDKEMAIYDFKVCSLSYWELKKPQGTRICSARFLRSPCYTNSSQAFDNGNHPTETADYLLWKAWKILIYFCSRTQSHSLHLSLEFFQGKINFHTCICSAFGLVLLNLELI